MTSNIHSAVGVTSGESFANGQLQPMQQYRLPLNIRTSAHLHWIMFRLP